MTLDAVILCGGLGTRIRSEVPSLPKAMAPIHGRPFLEYQMDYLIHEGVRHFILAIGHLSIHIENHFGSNYRGIPITYSREEEALGTGGATRQAMQHVLESPFLALNGDTYFPVPLADFRQCHAQSGAQVSLALADRTDATRYGGVEVGPDGLVRAFTEKGIRGPAKINGGVYIVEKPFASLLAFPKKNFSFETEILINLVEQNKLYAFCFDSIPFIDIGTPSDYRKAASLIPPQETKAT